MGTPHFLFRTPHLIRATPQKIKKATPKNAVLKWSHSLSISSLQHKIRGSIEPPIFFYFFANPCEILRFRDKHNGLVIEKGMDVHEYPLKYNNLSLKHHGHATTVDSLVAVKKYVFDRQEISLAELREALKQNWVGFEELQRKITADSEKYGNNLPLPDKIMTDISNHLADRYCGRKLKRGGVLRLGTDSVYHCVIHGKVTSATPDGRNAGQPISKNMCASDGMDRGGITAYMQSVLKIDVASFVDGVPLDYILHPSAVEGEKGLADFVSLIKNFLDNGGFCIQGNIVSQATLKDAQLHPEKYATLQVRVCGWNEYFVKLGKVKQDMFIKQCEVSG